MQQVLLNNNRQVLNSEFFLLLDWSPYQKKSPIYPTILPIPRIYIYIYIYNLQSIELYPFFIHYFFHFPLFFSFLFHCIIIRSFSFVLSFLASLPLPLSLLQLSFFNLIQFLFIHSVFLKCNFSFLFSLHSLFLSHYILSFLSFVNFPCLIFFLSYFLSTLSLPFFHHHYFFIPFFPSSFSFFLS